MRDIKLIIFDVDGTLTDGGYYINQDGYISKKYHCRDLDALRELSISYKVIFLSKSTKSNQHWAAYVPVDYYFCPGKKEDTLDKVMKDLRVTPEEAIYVGDSLQDLECIKRIPLSFCPKDADPELIKFLTLRYIRQKDKSYDPVLSRNGGDAIAGAIQSILTRPIS